LSRDFNSDNFNYRYDVGTNRVLGIEGENAINYSYDYNGNLTDDAVNDIADIKYDYRNLITEMCYNTSDEEYTYKVVYKYDEAGNRIRKTALRQAINSSNPEDPDYGIWFTIKDEFYVRDASGRERAKYSGNDLEYWNIWGGNDLVGRIDAEGESYYYLKDHLGNIRAVLNSDYSVVEGRDYDPWGYVIREYNVSNMDEYTPNKFTGKERDWESGYDYFGARYYDARIGRWGQTEPLYDKYLSYSPYQYGLLNPMKLVDADGKEVRATTAESQQVILNTLPKEIRSNIVFNDNGFVDKNIFNSIDSKSGNFEALKTLVNDSRIYDVSVASGFTYMDESGETHNINFGEISIGNAEDVSEMGPRTLEVGNLGVTMVPGEEHNRYNSPDEMIRIVINAGLSSEGKSQNFSHEAYGHAYLFSLGESWKHVPDDDMVETNYKLYNQIRNRINETKLNMEEK
jgi:RHS repeat-associated protein